MEGSLGGGRGVLLSVCVWRWGGRGGEGGKGFGIKERLEHT